MKVRVVDHYRPRRGRLALLLSCRCVVELKRNRVPQTFPCPKGHQPKGGRPRKSRVPLSRPRLGPFIKSRVFPVAEVKRLLRPRPPEPLPARVYSDEELLELMGSPNEAASRKAADLFIRRRRAAHGLAEEQQRLEEAGLPDA